MRIKSFEENGGILYLVATPIGNLEDVTFRAIRILKEVDIIYCEDTRTSQPFLMHYDIKTKKESYHKFNENDKKDEIVKLIKGGMKAALITDAGLPIVSDPGYSLVKALRDEGLRVSVIPGPSAGISALISSGLNPSPYLFYGFLKSKESERDRELEELKYEKATLIFYEAPHRINETLNSIYKIFGNRKASVLRELTKLHEEYVAGNLSDIKDLDNLKGEMVIVVEGYVSKEEILNPIEKIDDLIKNGYRLSDAVKEVARIFSLKKNDLYDLYLKEKNKGEI